MGILDLGINPLLVTQQRQATQRTAAQIPRPPSAIQQRVTTEMQKPVHVPPTFNPAPNPFADLDFSGIDFGILGQGFTGPAREPNSPAPTGRFDYKTPGAGLAFSQLSNEAAARAFQEGVRLFNKPRFEGVNVDPQRPEASGLANAAFGSLSPVFQGANIQQEGFQKFIQDPTPEQIQAAQLSNQGQFFDPATNRLYVDSGGGAGNTYISEAMELTGMSLDELAKLGPAESAILFDAVIRAREFKNQLPKRRLEVGPFSIHPAALIGGAFGAQALAGAVQTGALSKAVGSGISAVKSGLSGIKGALAGSSGTTATGGVTGAEAAAAEALGGPAAIGGLAAGDAAGGIGMGLGSTLLNTALGIGGDIAGGLAGTAIGNLLGGNDLDKAIKALSGDETLLDFTGGGLRSDFAGDRFTISDTPQRRSVLAGIQGALGTAANQRFDLANQVRPGFGRLTDARVQAVDTARSRAIGDLRESLARRRISGSSFANDTIARAEAEFAKLEGEARAQSFIEELALQGEQLDKAAQFRVQSLEVALNELSAQADVGLQLATRGVGAMQGLAQSQAELLLASATSRGDLIAPILKATTQRVGDLASKGLGSLFGV